MILASATLVLPTTAVQRIVLVSGVIRSSQIQLYYSLIKLAVFLRFIIHTSNHSGTKTNLQVCYRVFFERANLLKYLYYKKTINMFIFTHYYYNVKLSSLWKHMSYILMFVAWLAKRNYHILNTSAFYHNWPRVLLLFLRLISCTFVFSLPHTLLAMHRERRRSNRMRQ